MICAPSTRTRISLLAVLLVTTPGLTHAAPIDPAVDPRLPAILDILPTVFPPSPQAALATSAEAIGLSSDRIQALAGQRTDASPSLDAAYLKLVAAAGLAPPIDGAPDVPAPLAPAIISLIDAVADATAMRTRALDALGSSDHATLAALDDAYRASRTHGDRAILERAWSLQGGLPAALDRHAFAAAAHLLLDAGLQAAAELEALRATPEWPVVEAALPGCVEDVLHLVVLCGTGDDTTYDPYILEIDLGGNDVHATNAGGSGIGVLWSGPNGLPVALALDLAGDDTYVGTAQVQGTAASSAGVLIDLDGDDTYTATGGFFTFAQGAGHLGGVGVLYDALGDDTYAATSNAWDTQGFGILGGIGVLVDDVGNDVYTGGVFAGGGGDFNAIGAVYDGLGWDSYTGRKWSQGFADGAGIGLLWDAEGNDAYRAQTESQGASRGGLGILFDALGDDGYLAADFTSQGWGIDGPAWKPVNDVLAAAGQDVLGVGVLLDLGGQDGYSGHGCNGCFWGTGYTGLALDAT